MPGAAAWREDVCFFLNPDTTNPRLVRSGAQAWRDWIDPFKDGSSSSAKSRRFYLVFIDRRINLVIYGEITF